MKCKAYDPDSGDKIASATVDMDNESVGRHACVSKLQSMVDQDEYRVSHGR